MTIMSKTTTSQTLCRSQCSDSLMLLVEKVVWIIGPTFEAFFLLLSLCHPMKEAQLEQGIKLPSGSQPHPLQINCFKSGCWYLFPANSAISFTYSNLLKLCYCEITCLPGHKFQLHAVLLKKPISVFKIVFCSCVCLSSEMIWSKFIFELFLC